MNHTICTFVHVTSISTCLTRESELDTSLYSGKLDGMSGSSCGSTGSSGLPGHCYDPPALSSLTGGLQHLSTPRSELFLRDTQGPLQTQNWTQIKF